METHEAVRVATRISELWKTTSPEQIEALINGFKKRREFDPFTPAAVDKAVDETWFESPKFFDLEVFRKRLGVDKQADRGATGYDFQNQQRAEVNREGRQVLDEVNRASAIIAGMSDSDVQELWGEFVTKSFSGKTLDWANKWTMKQIRGNKPFLLHLAVLMPAAV